MNRVFDTQRFNKAITQFTQRSSARFTFTFTLYIHKAQQFITNYLSIMGEFIRSSISAALIYMTNDNNYKAVHIISYASPRGHNRDSNVLVRGARMKPVSVDKKLGKTHASSHQDPISNLGHIDIPTRMYTDAT